MCVYAEVLLKKLYIAIYKGRRMCLNGKISNFTCDLQCKKILALIVPENAGIWTHFLTVYGELCCKFLRMVKTHQNLLINICVFLWAPV
jgi:hypothetical protein